MILKPVRIVQNYSSENRQLKEINKRHIQRRFGLEVSDIPLITMVTRLTKQKGLELVRGVFHEIMTENIQMIVLGTGDPEFENFFREMEHQYGENLKLILVLMKILHISFMRELICF